MFTSVEKLSNTERRVKTRVPANLFDYKATGASIDITGSVTTRLANGRKLRVMVDTTLFEDSSNEDPVKFELIVGLQPELVVKDEEDAPIKIEMNSSTTIVSVGSKVSIIIGMAIAFASAIW